MIGWTFEIKKLDLQYNWKLSRNETIQKINFFITVKDKDFTGTGEIAPNIRYGETYEKVLEELDRFCKSAPEKIESVTDIEHWGIEKLSNAVKFGVESAAIHYLCCRQGCTVPALLNIARVHSIPTCYTIPVMEPAAIPTFYKTNALSRFKTIKIKINHETGLESLMITSKLCNSTLIIDGNETWPDLHSFLPFLKEIHPYNIQFIEQPFPAAQIDDYIALKKISPFDVFGDESITTNTNWKSIKQQFHGVNIKLMKAGGYINAIRSITTARAMGLKVMIGCMVETTLGISSALDICGLADLADLDGFLLIKDEPYQLLKENNGEIFRI